VFDWLGLVCFANKNKICQLSYSQFQTNQKGGQQYSDTSPFSIPCLQAFRLGRKGLPESNTQAYYKDL
jgi:hypothetical protein